MEASTPSRRRFALLIDADPATRGLLRPLLPLGLQLIQSKTGATGLELLQRIPARFALALVSLELAGLSGAIVIDTIRLFRPDVPVICLTADPEAVTASVGPCLPRSADVAELRAQLNGLLASAGRPWTGPAASAAAVEQARTAFSLGGDLNAAARELARGMPGGPTGGP